MAIARALIQMGRGSTPERRLRPGSEGGGSGISSKFPLGPFRREALAASTRRVDAAKVRLGLLALGALLPKLVTRSSTS